MFKSLTTILVVLFLATSAHAADTKLQDMAAGTPEGTDIIYFVDEPGSGDTPKKVTFTALQGAIDTDTDTNANTACSGTTTYLDGEGNCDDISSVYEPAGITESDISDLAHTTDTNANTICTGTDVYLDGEGNCDTISGGGGGGEWSTNASGIDYTAGNVGIGTTAPTVALDIVGAVKVTNRISGGEYYGYTLTNNSPGVNSAGGAFRAYPVDTRAGLVVQDNGYNGNIQEWQDSSGNVLSVVDSGGNLGVQTNNPTSALHIGNTDYVDITDGLAFGDGDTGFYESGDDALTFIVDQALFPATGGSGGSPDFFVSGYARFDGPVILYDNLYATQFLQIYDNFGLQLGSGSDYTVGYHSASDTFRIADGTNLGSNIRLLIDSTGQVGIGTTAPSTALDVTGTATADYFVGDGSGLTGISGSGEWSDDGTTLTTLDSGRDVTVGGTLTTETLVVNGSGGGAMVMAYGSTDVTTTGTQVAVYGKDSSVYARKPSDGAVKDLFKDDFRFALGSPTDADAPFVFKAQNAITVTDIHCIVDSGTSVVIDVQECTSTGASCTTVDATITCDSDGAEDDGTLTNATIDAGDWVKLDIGTVTGTVGFMTGTVYYTE